MKQTEDSPEQGDNTILLRKARIVYGAPVRWKRNFSKKDSSRNDTEEEAAMNEGEVRYNSRLLACTRCGTEQETTDKRLKIKDGFRAISCIKCGKQQRVHSHKCKCKMVWHHSPLHKVDPQQHLLKRKRKKKCCQRRTSEPKRTGTHNRRQELLRMSRTATREEPRGQATTCMTDRCRDR